VSTLAPLLPLTFVMIAGPQLISAVFLATSTGWAKNTIAYIAGAAISSTVILLAAYFVVQGVKGGSDSAKSTGSTHTTIDIVLLVILVVLALMVYLKRGESEPPKWMGKLQGATPGFSFKLGFLLLGVFPTDLATSIAVGTKLAHEGASWALGLVFVAVTLFLLAIPALLVVVLGQRAQTFLPKVRQWMNDNSWVVSEIVIALFIVIELNSLLSG
jgi:hypothetical protein